MCKLLLSLFFTLVAANGCDIIFLIDSTNSISENDLSIQKEFFSSLIPYYLNTFVDTRIAIIEWSSAENTEIFYEFTDNQSIPSINTTLQNIPRNLGGGDVDSLFNFSLTLFKQQSQTSTTKIMLLPADITSDQTDNCHYDNGLINNNINLLVMFIHGSQSESSLTCFTQREEYGTGSSDWNSLLLSTTYDQVYTMSDNLCGETLQPSVLPSSIPSEQPTIIPSDLPTTQPSKEPSVEPSEEPSEEPSKFDMPTIGPSSEPSYVNPTNEPSFEPTLTIATSTLMLTEKATSSNVKSTQEATTSLTTQSTISGATPDATR